MPETYPDPTLHLDLRSGLPDALTVLLRDYPRAGWEAHPGFDGLVRFWLDRHMMFRRLTGMLVEASEARLDAKMDPRQFKANLSRMGSMLVGELHGHHNIEDHHYFPILSAKDPRIAQGFEVLDADHHALDGLLNRYVEAANAALQAPDSDTTAIGTFLKETRALDALLDRHLLDEEDLVVPVILKYGAGGLG